MINYRKGSRLKLLFATANIQATKECNYCNSVVVSVIARIRNVLNKIFATKNRGQDISYFNESFTSFITSTCAIIFKLEQNN